MSTSLRDGAAVSATGRGSIDDGSTGGPAAGGGGGGSGSWHDPSGGEGLDVGGGWGVPEHHDLHAFVQW